METSFLTVSIINSCVTLQNMPQNKILPENEQNVTEENCFRIISKKLNSDQFEIINFEEEAFATRNGFLGEHSSLKIHIQTENRHEKYTFFVKSLPKSEGQRNFAVEVGGSYKESSFFCKYLEKLKNLQIDLLSQKLPTCYLANEELIVLEDLNRLGYVTKSARSCLKNSEIKCALTTISKLHASGLIFEEKQKKSLVDEFGDIFQETFYSGKESSDMAFESCKSGIRAVIDMTHRNEMGISKELFTQLALHGIDEQKKFAKPSGIYRNTICHGDLWIKNFLFLYQSEAIKNCILVDFQTYRYAPPAQDVMAFIHLVSDKKSRDLHFEEWLNFYFEELRANLKNFGVENVFSKDEFLITCGFFKPFALTQSVTHFQTINLSEETIDQIFSDQEKSKRIMFVNKYDFIQKICTEDTVFRFKMFEAVCELRQYYQNK